MDIIIKIYFYLHFIFSYIGCFGWIFSPYSIPIQIIILISWYLNKNRCIISQIEYYYLGRTFMGDGKLYYVPSFFRKLLLINTFIGIIYYGFLKI